MRISWLEPGVVRVTRDALREHADGDLESLFTPGFRAPPAPTGLPAAEWPHIAEHVARAERVSQVVREDGLDAAIGLYGGSDHAIEMATLVLAAVEAEELTLDLVEAVLACEIDELVMYGAMLELLVEASRGQPERGLLVYEDFCDACVARRSDSDTWIERVGAVRDGLAAYYVALERLDDAHAVWLDRHREDRGDIFVALNASRTYLARGHVGRAVLWLDLGATRADDLGRDAMARTLRDKRDKLRQRLS